MGGGEWEEGEMPDCAGGSAAVLGLMKRSRRQPDGGAERVGRFL